MAPSSNSNSARGTPTPSLTKSNSSSKNQTSIAGFFKKKSEEPNANGTPKINGTSLPINSFARKTAITLSSGGSTQSMTPAPSSDPTEEIKEEEDTSLINPNGQSGANALPSPITPASALNEIDGNGAPPGFYSPSRKAKKVVNYAVDPDSDEDEDDEDAFKPTQKRRASKRRKTSVESDDDIFVGDGAGEDDVFEEDDFVVDDDSDKAMPTKKKRKRPSPAQSTSRHDAVPEFIGMESDEEVPAVSTAQQWSFDPTAVQSSQLANAPTRKATPKQLELNAKKGKAKPSKVERRYEWLEPAHITDIDKNRPNHPDYDPRTVYVPKSAWTLFSPFEHQYWEIKQKHWDTIVFFKKGKFYELYENDATIGHQLFDLKLTDRVNMRMVGVPEASLDIWANQFVAKGYKIARVDQVESALGKEMRERDSVQSGKAVKVDEKMKKIINRELACVLTSGTLVDPGMLQDDMSTYCMAIKESEQEGRPAFGIVFVDTATAQFFLTDFEDDVEMTKFETLIAQIRPREILLEKSCSSTKALRILKNSTGSNTSIVFLKASKEFWTADTACRELDAGQYFVNDGGDNIEAWPGPLRQAREKNEFVMSAFGALVQYLRTLQIERDIVTLGNVSWYDPIKSAGTLILDGKTLINLEIFANSFDGSSEGTLFSLLNRCITPFGKRTFKQWVCHPLMDAAKINARLDAVESLNADTTLRDQFTSQLSKLPDLERTISRIHAGVCKAQEFVRVLDGFEQIDYTMGVLRNMGSGEGIIGQLVTSMPDMRELFKYWNSAFDHAKAKEAGLLIPERGVEEDFDTSQDRIQSLLTDLETLLKKTRKELKSNDIVYADNGKEIYQLEVPVKVKSIPKNWDQMSATIKVKRYYNPELRGLVRKLQEAQETHGQIVKEVSGRFFKKFDEDYVTWLTAVRIVAQLDCLMCLAKASSALGEPSCRPEFVHDESSVVEFEDLRHPCMLPNVTDFIPNNVKLGGGTPNINLLTGANAAGKSTVLRMTCIAVIMAQIGCYVPAISARLTPVDRIMSRLGAQDNIFAAQSTFFVELAETKKILSEATPRSLVILDELGRGTSSYDGVAVAQAVLHHVASHIGCVGFFATHYHSLAAEFATHPEVRNCRMRIHVDDENRRVTFLYKLEDGVAEGSFGMHCASMCGIPEKVVEEAEVAAKKWEHTAKIKESLEVAKQGCWIPLGIQSDIAWMLREQVEEAIGVRGVDVLRKAIKGL
ncbi:MAG: DNA mismatch repair protein msh6 [Alectoria fallacina]|uniref:DNA mismatch repair protein n=1 Tax=Alectoria fallacina TaxID=1903189 RepID=A0A8H3J8X9_9LECA|nr:MAG: DNA mismatch repair protein msh6 [Alectoria fallacina]